MKGQKLLATLAISAVLFTGCGLKSMQGIIKVNDEVITQGQFDKLLDKQIDNSGFKKMGIDIKGNKEGFMYLMLKDRVINELIVNTLLEEEMAKRNIKVTNKDVDDAIKDIIVNKIGSKDKLNILLKQNGISASQFKNDIRQEVKMRKLALQLGNSEVSEQEAKKYYNDNIDKFKYPERVRASHILVSANPAEIEEVITSDPNNKDLKPEEVKAKVTEELNARKAKADKLYNEAKANIDSFAKLAKENSDDTVSAERGGDLGFFAKEEMVPEFSKAAFAQRPNSVAPVVKSVYGYHIILVTDRSEAGQVPFEKAKADIVNILTTQKQLDLLDNLVESLKKNAKIEYVNSEYDPQNIQKTVQQQVQKQIDASKQAQPEK